MSTEIYPPLPPLEIARLQEEHCRAEQRWLIDTLIKPELPNIIETLSRCFDIITSQDEIKLAITSSRTEQIKGIITRRSSEIIDLDINLHLSTLSKRPLRLKLKQNAGFELQQLQDLTRLINLTATDVILLKEHDGEDVRGFMTQLNKVLHNLTKCNVLLNKPNESLLFPQHSLKFNEVFEMDQRLMNHQDQLTCDIFLLNTELSFEFKSLEKITEQPWCLIDSEGRSHVDKLRDDLKLHKVKLTDILEQDKKHALSNVFKFHKFTAQDYLTRGITFNNQVVIELEKLLVHCQDPNLLTIGTKLNGLEHIVSKMYKNLDLALM